MASFSDSANSARIVPEFAPNLELEKRPPLPGWPILVVWQFVTHTMHDLKTDTRLFFVLGDRIYIYRARAFFKGYIKNEVSIFWLPSLSSNGIFAAAPKCQYIRKIGIIFRNLIKKRISQLHASAA